MISKAFASILNKLGKTIESLLHTDYLLHKNNVFTYFLVSLSQKLLYKAKELVS